MTDTTAAIYDVLAAYTGLSDARNRAIAMRVADAISAHIEAREAAAAAKEREACAQELDCGCAVRPRVLARLATDGERCASYLCVHGDACCALQAAAIRARGKETNNG